MNLRRTTLLLSLVAVGAMAFVTGCQNPRKGYQPEQPIPFSHRLHAGENDIPCQYCHVSVAAGRHSTVPSGNMCMNCHREGGVSGKTPEGMEAIKTIRTAHEKGERVKWVKVHDLADFAYYDHKPHIAAGLECSTCHGDVAGTDELKTVVEFNMGWCVNCHREHGAPINCSTCHR